MPDPCPKKKPNDCIKNITEKTMPTAAVDCVSICPTKKVSAILYRLVIIMLIIVGTAIVPITRCMGASVRNV